MNVEWIPCEERTPEKSGWYLVTLSYFNPEVSYTPVVRSAFYRKEHGHWEDIFCVLKVDAWAHLPEGYKK